MIMIVIVMIIIIIIIIVGMRMRGYSRFGMRNDWFCEIDWLIGRWEEFEVKGIKKSRPGCLAEDGLLSKGNIWNLVIIHHHHWLSLHTEGNNSGWIATRITNELPSRMWKIFEYWRGCNNNKCVEDNTLVAGKAVGELTARLSIHHHEIIYQNI